MKKCNNCSAERDHHRLMAYELHFCSHKCLVDFADREKHHLQKSETYEMCKRVMIEDALRRISDFGQQFGCGKPSCCQIKTNNACVCRSFDADALLSEALQSESTEIGDEVPDGKSK
jgi:hypothetical protein